MMDVGKDVYFTIGMMFYRFITGKPYNTELLRNHIQILNAMHVQRAIEDGVYDYYVRVLEAAIEFFEP